MIRALLQRHVEFNRLQWNLITWFSRSCYCSMIYCKCIPLQSFSSFELSLKLLTFPCGSLVLAQLCEQKFICDFNSLSAKNDSMVLQSHFFTFAPSRTALTLVLPYLSRSFSLFSKLLLTWLMFLLVLLSLLLLFMIDVCC